MNLELDIRSILTIGYYLVAVTTVIFVILDNRPPLKTLSWILVLLFLPLIGLIFYFYFGHNFKKERLFEGKRRIDSERTQRMLKEQSIDINLHHREVGEAIQKWKVIKLLLKNSKTRLSVRNKLKILNNGPETFNEIFRAIKSAKRHIHIEYYIIEEGEVADQLKNLLIQKLGEGVEVRFIYDSVGSWNLSSEFLNDLETAGAKVSGFMQVLFRSFTSKLNYRNHRKIIIVDGKIGFLGGINISDKYLSVDPELGIPWRDTHLSVEGECVYDLQVIFLTDWYFLSDENLENEEEYFPSNQIRNNKPVQILASGPDTEYAAVMKAYFSAITTAEKSVFIVSPYFIPNESVLTAIKSAAGSGVEVKIILPSVSDTKLVQFSSRSYFEDLMEMGVEIYLYQTGFIHSKIIIVDGLLSSIGTANMDFRSFEQNMEVNAIIYDRDTASQLTRQFLIDLDNSEKINPESWKNRSRLIKIIESFSRLFAPLL